MQSTSFIKNIYHSLLSRLKGQRGNAIAYVAMLLIIFGVIGAIMTSLLTSSVVTTTTPNHSRRALYMTEAGMRYALSELRNEEDWKTRIEELNTITHTVSAGETFTINIFPPWYQAGFYQNKTSGGTLTLTVPEGEMPPEYTFDTSAPYLSIVNNNYTGNTIPAESVAEIDSFNRVDANTVEFTVRDDFIVSNTEFVCMAVNVDQETINQVGIDPLTPGESIFIAEQARHVFPKYDGAIEINRSVYFYDELIHDDTNNRVELTNITGRPESKFEGDFIVAVSDYAVLSSRNHIITVTGTSENISAGGNLSESINVADRTELDEGMPPPDIDAAELTDNISEVETPVPGFLSVDTAADSLSLGGNYNPPSSSAFGAAWYDADKTVGGDTNYCQSGGCLFEIGFRTFYTLDYTGDGDGLTFSWINGSNNTAGSVGGDIEQSELLAYAGDSRTNVAGTAWLDGTGDGLQNPKMAVEFDALTNYDAAFESTTPLNYCSASNLKPDTRKDPVDNGSRDAVQYVFWGNTALDIACRGDDASYDDNRHDAEGSETSDWPSPANVSGDMRSQAVISPDGTRLYVATINGVLHALDIVDGSEIWQFPASAGLPAIASFTGNPAVNDTGDTVYVAGNDSGRQIWAVNTSDGSLRWRFPDSDPAVSSLDNIKDSSPAVDRNGIIYIAESVGSADGYMRAIHPNGIQKWAYDLNENAESFVIVDRTGGTYDGYIYVGRDGGAVIQWSPASADGTPEWTATTSSDIEASVAVSPDGSVVYAVDQNNKMNAFNASDGSSAWGSNPDAAGQPHDSNLAVDTSGGAYHGTIYSVTSDEGGTEGAYLSSFKADGSGFNWKDVPVKDAAASSPEHTKSSPEVGPDGTIYIGTSDNYVYAIDPSDGSVKWRSDLIGNVWSTPKAADDGTVYVGSDANRVWAFGNYALPRNRRDLQITSTGSGVNTQVAGVDVDVDNEVDWLEATAAKKRWAVRIEVERDTVANGLGNYEYTLRSWVRQCDQLDCSDILGTNYQNTRIKYSLETPHLEQMVELSAADHALFDRFLFGFTTATQSGNSQNAVIEYFQLSFIRPGDPEIIP